MLRKPGLGLPRWYYWWRSRLPVQETWETLVQSLGRENHLEKGRVIRSLENPMHRGDWQATVHGVAKSWTWLKRDLAPTNPISFSLPTRFYDWRFEGWIKSLLYDWPKKETNKKKTNKPKPKRKPGLACISNEDFLKFVFRKVPE